MRRSNKRSRSRSPARYDRGSREKDSNDANKHSKQEDSQKYRTSFHPPIIPTGLTMAAPTSALVPTNVNLQVDSAVDDEYVPEKAQTYVNVDEVVIDLLKRKKQQESPSSSSQLLSALQTVSFKLSKRLSGQELYDSVQKICLPHASEAVAPTSESLMSPSDTHEVTNALIHENPGEETEKFAETESSGLYDDVYGDIESKVEDIYGDIDITANSEDVYADVGVVSEYTSNTLTDVTNTKISESLPFPLTTIPYSMQDLFGQRLATASRFTKGQSAASLCMTALPHLARLFSESSH